MQVCNFRLQKNFSIDNVITALMHHITRETSMRLSHTIVALFLGMLLSKFFSANDCQPIIAFLSLSIL